MPAARATASAGAGRPTSTRTAGLAAATATARPGTGTSVTLPGPAVSTSSARPAGTLASGGITTHGQFSTSPFGGGSFGGLPGLPRGRASAPAGRPASFEHLAVSALPGAFGDDPFGDAPFGGDGSSNGRALATATAPAGRPTSIARYRTAAARAIAARGTPLNVTALLDQASAEADRVPTFTLRADWNDDGGYSHPLSDLTPVVEEFTLNREIATDLPDAVGLVSGTAATTLDVSLGGRWDPNGPIEPNSVVEPWYLFQGAALPFSLYYTADFTLALEFSVTEPTYITAIGYYRPVTPVAASMGAIFDVATQTEVPGTRVTFTGPPAAPAWVSTPLGTPFLPEVNRRYKVGVLFSCFSQAENYFTEGGPGELSTDFGPLRLYSALDATGGRQGSYHAGSTLAYPESADADGKLYGVDIVAATVTEFTGNPTAATTDPVKAFAPYRLDADLASHPVVGRRVALTTGMQTVQGPVTQPQLAGTLSAFEPSAADRRVRMRLLDDVNKLRAPIFQQAWGTDLVLRVMWGENGYPARINSQWLIDRVLRTNGYFASPPPGAPLDDPSLLLSATMHGSSMAEAAAFSGQPVESISGATTVPLAPWIVGDHPFKMLAPNPDAAIKPKGSWNALRSVFGMDGFTYAASGWFRLDGSTTLNATLLTIYASKGPNYSSTNHTTLTVYLKDGKPGIGLVKPDQADDAPTTVTTTAAPPATPTWLFCGFSWQFTSTGATLSIFRSDVGHSVGASIAFTPHFGVDWNPNPTVAYEAVIPFTNISLWGPATPPGDSWVGQTWNPTARIDKGLNEWCGMPEFKGIESYSLIKEVTEAEAASFAFDADGVPVFTSRAVAHLSDTQEEVTADRSLTDLVTAVDESTLANYIPATVARWEMDWWRVIIEADDPNEYAVAANSSRIFYLSLPDDVAQTWTAGLNGPGRHLSADDWNNRNSQQFQPFLTFSTSYYDNPFEATGPFDNVAIGANRVDARTMMLVVTNPASRPIRFGTPDKFESDLTYTPGTGALRIPGRIVKAGDPAAAGASLQTSIDTYGQRTYALPESRWRQSFNSATSIAKAILAWTGQPRPVLAEIDVPHNPRRKLRDQIRVTDPEGLGSVTGKVAAIRTTFSADEGARDRLLVRPISPPTGW